MRSHQQNSTDTSTNATIAITVPIGAPISHTYLYLVSESEPYKEGEEGAEGELWIGGVGVARGYLHAPELTAQVRLYANVFID